MIGSISLLLIAPLLVVAQSNAPTVSPSQPPAAPTFAPSTSLAGNLNDDASFIPGVSEGVAIFFVVIGGLAVAVWLGAFSYAHCCVRISKPRAAAAEAEVAMLPPSTKDAPPALTAPQQPQHSEEASPHQPLILLGPEFVPHCTGAVCSCSPRAENQKNFEFPSPTSVEESKTSGDLPTALPTDSSEVHVEMSPTSAGSEPEAAQERNSEVVIDVQQPAEIEV